MDMEEDKYMGMSKEEYEKYEKEKNSGRPGKKHNPGYHKPKMKEGY